MDRRRQLIIGLVMLIGGMTVVAIGAIFPSSNPLVALGWLLLVPLVVSFCGAVFVFVGLARGSQIIARSVAVYRIIGSVAVAGLGLGLGFPAAGIVSQVPDSAAGLNGTFIPGSAPPLAAFLCGGIGLSIGLVIGAVAALIWWLFRRRHLRPGAAAVDGA